MKYKFNNKSPIKLIGYLFILLNFLVLSCVQGQSILDASVRLDSIPGSDTTKFGNFYVQVADTINVSEVEITLSSSEDSIDIASQIFQYDQTSGLPIPLEYNRVGNVIQLKIGPIPLIPTYFASVRTKDLTNIWSDRFIFIFN